jgi:hypothetical protein
MSYDFIVYVKKGRLPTPEALAAQLSSRLPALVLPPTFDVRTARGYIAAQNDGREAGFDVLRGAITPASVEDYRAELREAGEPDDDHLAIIGTTDTRLTFSGKTNDEIAVAKEIAGAVATLCGAFLCDPQTGSIVEGRLLDG